MKFIRKNYLLIFVLILALFFRLARFSQFLHFTGDDETLFAALRHITWDGSPMLLVPNSYLGFGLGPFFHYLLVPFFVVFSFDIVKMQVLASFLGAITTFFIYLTGTLLTDKKLGIVASFLYASSFLMGVMDRRLWQLSLDGLMAILTIYVLINLVRKRYTFFPLLAIPIGFSLHSDMSLFVVVLLSLAIIYFFRVSLTHKYFAHFLIVICIFLSPFVLAEIVYGNAVLAPVIKSVTRPLRGEKISHVQEPDQNLAYIYANTFSNAIFSHSSKKADVNFCHNGCSYQIPLFSPILQLLTVGILSFGLFRIRSKYRKNKALLLLPANLLCFVFGLTIFNKIFHGPLNQNYFLVIFPTFFVLFAYSITQIFKNGYYLVLLLALYSFVNLYTLLNSKVEYPLSEKVRLVNESIMALGDKNFIIAASSGAQTEGGGWTELFTLNGKVASGSYWYDLGAWIYQAYSLYPKTNSSMQPEYIVYIKKFGDVEKYGLPIVSRRYYSDLEILVYSTK